MYQAKHSRRTKKQRTHSLTSDYPDNWAEIASAVKETADNRCVRCGHPNDKPFNRWTDHGHEASSCDLFCHHPRDSTVIFRIVDGKIVEGWPRWGSIQ